MMWAQQQLVWWALVAPLACCSCDRSGHPTTSRSAAAAVVHTANARSVPAAPPPAAAAASNAQASAAPPAPHNTTSHVRGTRSERVARATIAIFREHRDHGARLAAVSALFLGERYQLSPLGEGEDGAVDTDPVVRYDAFDCVTYVEEVMALSWYPTPRQSTRQLQQVRYAHGEISYAHRNHIMMAQWIPQNIAAGFVRDITAQVAPQKVRQARLKLDQAAFESTQGRALVLSPQQRPVGEYTLPIVPL
ncbi:MAG TPA: DUF1460 domain-containing protein, partial [Sorangium sp.]|nr:DUF1460 domain-containing protein [Sorangium sp.]